MAAASEGQVNAYRAGVQLSENASADVLDVRPSRLRGLALPAFRAEGLDMATGYGVEGGGAGAVGEQWIQPVDGAQFIPPKYGVRRLGPARMVADTPGGGGWGDPFAGAPELVLRDVRDGILNRDAAWRDYSVVVAADGRTVDTPKTVATRAQVRGGPAE